MPYLVACYGSAAGFLAAGVRSLFRDPADWMRRAALNTARMGWFSSDRTIAGYAKDIWGAKSLL